MFADVEGAFSAVAVGLFLEVSLGVRELGAQHLGVRGPVQLWQCRLVLQGGAQLWQAAHIWFLFVQRLERGALERRVVGGVVPELCGGKPLAPLSWRVVHRAPQVHLEALVDALRLAIRLRVVRCGVEHFGSGGEQFAPHGAGEDLVAVLLTLKSGTMVKVALSYVKINSNL